MRKIWDARQRPATELAGDWNSLIASAQSSPQGFAAPTSGHGFFCSKVSLGGVASWVGRLANGKAIAGSNFLWPNAVLPFHQVTGAKSSLLGALDHLPLPVTSSGQRNGGLAISGELQAYEQGAASRYHRVTGGTAPTLAEVGLGTWTLRFSSGGLVGPISVEVSLPSNGVAKIVGPNPNRIWLTQDRQGKFSAGYQLPVRGSRRVTGLGLFATDENGALIGGGYSSGSGAISLERR
jgi:hypothetical protein